MNMKNSNSKLRQSMHNNTTKMINIDSGNFELCVRKWTANEESLFKNIYTDLNLKT